MRTHSTWISGIIATSLFLSGPATSFAATSVKEAAATTVTEEDILNALEQTTDVAAPALMDGRGGGGGYIMPPYGNGVQVDASVTREVTPDFVAINAYCDSGKKASRQEAKDALDQLYTDIKNAVGSDGRVRRQGSVSIYPYYGPMGEDTGSYTSNISIFIRILKPEAAERISDVVENKGCGVNWDVRLVDTEEFELSLLDTLSSRLNKRKVVFEKLLGKKLTNVMSASLNTWADGYSTYDPATNKVDATTTLSVSFELGNRSSLPASTSSTRRTRATPAK